MGPSIDATVAAVGSDRDALHSVRGIEFSSESVPVARAAGIRHASAELVGFAETHCYPGREWAESLVRTHRADWAVVGPEFQNENPQTAISRACMLVDYGLWTAPAEPGEVDHVPVTTPPTSARSSSPTGIASRRSCRRRPSFTGSCGAAASGSTFSPKPGFGTAT